MTGRSAFRCSFAIHAAVAAGVRRSDPVEHVDLAPTILALAGLPVPPSFTGNALFGEGHQPQDPCFRSAPEVFAAIVAFRRDRRRRLKQVAGSATQPILASSDQYAVRSARWKYLVTERAEELYAIDTDANEEHDVAADQPESPAADARRLEGMAVHLPRPRASSRPPRSLASLITTPWLQQAVSFALIFLAVMAVAMVCGFFLRFALQAVGLSLMDRLLGGLFGLATVVLVVSVVLMMANKFSPSMRAQLETESTLAPYLFRSADALAAFLEKHDATVQQLQRQIR